MAWCSQKLHEVGWSRLPRKRISSRPRPHRRPYSDPFRDGPFPASSGFFFGSLRLSSPACSTPPIRMDQNGEWQWLTLLEITTLSSVAPRLRFVDLAIVFFGFLGGLVAFGLLVPGGSLSIISLPVKDDAAGVVR